MSHDREQVFIYSRMCVKKIQVSSSLSLHEIMSNLDIRQHHIMYDPLVSSVITYSEMALNVKCSFSSNISFNTARVPKSSDSVTKSMFAFICPEEQSAAEPKIYMVPLGVKPIVTNRELLDEIASKREEQLVQKIWEVGKDDDYQTGASQFEESALEMQKRQKEQETSQRELESRYEEHKKELGRRFEENKREMQGHYKLFEAVQKELDQQHQATLDELRRQDQQYEAIQEKLKVRARA